MSRGVGCVRGLGLALLWLWLWRAAAAPIQPPAQEPPYATGVALKRQKEKAKRCGVVRGKRDENPECTSWCHCFLIGPFGAHYLASLHDFLYL